MRSSSSTGEAEPCCPPQLDTPCIILAGFATSRGLTGVTDHDALVFAGRNEDTVQDVDGHASDKQSFCIHAPLKPYKAALNMAHAMCASHAMLAMRGAMPRCQLH